MKLSLAIQASAFTRDKQLLQETHRAGFQTVQVPHPLPLGPGGTRHAVAPEHSINHNNAETAVDSYFTLGYRV